MPSVSGEKLSETLGRQVSVD